MHWTNTSYIPTSPSHKSTLQRRDMLQLSDDLGDIYPVIATLRTTNKLKATRKKSRMSPVQSEMSSEAMMETIVHAQLSANLPSNPSFFSRVPEYDPPVENIRSMDEIHTIQLQKEYLPHMEFVRNNVYMLSTPLTPEEFMSDTAYARNAETIVHTISVYSSPSGRLLEQVGYAIYLLVPPSPAQIELLGISVLKRPRTLQAAIERLGNMKVSNWRDLHMTSETLSKAYENITGCNS